MQHHTQVVLVVQVIKHLNQVNMEDVEQMEALVDTQKVLVELEILLEMEATVKEKMEPVDY